MKIALVGYAGSGKSTLFEWLTGVKPDPSLCHTAQTCHGLPCRRPGSMLLADDPPAEEDHAGLPGDPADTRRLEPQARGNAAGLVLIREGRLPGASRSPPSAAWTPAAELQSFVEDLILADMEIVSGRIHRVEEQQKKPLPRQGHEDFAARVCDAEKSAGGHGRGKAAHGVQHE